MSNSQIQFIKYLLVGGLNLVFGIVTFYFLLYIVKFNYLLAFSLTWILGVLLTYIINSLWTFRPVERLYFRSRLLKYTLVYLTSYLVNIFLLKTITEYTLWDPFYIQFGLIPIVMIINFLGMKFWSLK